jgi:hypothetical protein
MGQEFFIKSTALEDKVRQILPSQGGLGANFDLSASTQIIPIVDLTESAEGSEVRADLQTAIGFNSTTFFVQNATNTVLINNTGYYRVFGRSSTAATGTSEFNLFDGTTSKQILAFGAQAGTVEQSDLFDFNIFLRAGDSLRATTNSTSARLAGITRQIATITGELVDP